MADKTAMQQLIRQLNGSIQLIDEHGVLNDYAQCRKGVYEVIRDITTSLLETERQQIIDAYNEGVDVVSKPNEPHIAEQYYSNKYGSHP